MISKFSAPLGVQLTSESTSDIKVSFPAPVAGSLVDSYQAIVKDESQKCSVLVSASPHECSLSSLEAGKQYKILVTSSVEAEQSIPDEKTGYTLPEGSHYLSLFFQFMFLYIHQFVFYCLKNRVLLKLWGLRRHL